MNVSGQSLDDYRWLMPLYYGTLRIDTPTYTNLNIFYRSVLAGPFLGLHYRPSNKGVDDRQGEMQEFG